MNPLRTATPGALALLVLGAGACSAPEKLSQVGPGELTECVGTGNRRAGVFDKPFEYMVRHLNRDLAPTLVMYADDARGEATTEVSHYLYDSSGRQVGLELDDDGDGLIEFSEHSEWTDDGRLLSRELVDARGHLREAEYRFYARYDRLFRVLHDLDGDGAIDEIEEHDWDADGRLRGIDTFAAFSNAPISRLTVDYVEPAPRLDRLERFDGDGDNQADEGVRFLYNDDGLLASTGDLDGNLTVYTWDLQGRIASSLTTGPAATITFEATWTDLGLPSWTRTDTDSNGDGEVDQLAITEWTWACDGPNADG